MEYGRWPEFLCLHLHLALGQTHQLSYFLALESLVSKDLPMPSFPVSFSFDLYILSPYYIPVLTRQHTVHNLPHPLSDQTPPIQTAK